MRKAAVLLTLLFPSIAAAQSAPGWTESIRLGKPVLALTHTGDRVEGIAGQIAFDGIVVATPVGVRKVTYDEMRRFQRRDPVSNGIGIGAVIGGSIGLLAAIEADCIGGRSCGPEGTSVIFAGALYGGLIGWGVDAAIKGWATLYEREAKVSVAVTPRRGGVAASMRWRWK